MDLRILLRGSAAFLVLAALATLTVSDAPSSSPPDLRLSLNLGPEDDGSGLSFRPTVVNDSPEVFEQAVLRVAVELPGEDRPLMTVSDFDHVCHDEDALNPEDADPPACPDHLDEPERCEFSGPGSPPVSPGHADYIEYPARGPEAECVKDIFDGVNEFSLSLGIADFGPHLVDRMSDYPDLTVTAELIVDGRTVDSASEEVTSTYPETWDRVAFVDVPERVPTTATELADGLTWRVVISNDTATEFRGTLTVQPIGAPPHAVHSPQDGLLAVARADDALPNCPLAESQSDYERLSCEEVTVAPGETFEAELTVFANPKWVDRVEERCQRPQRHAPCQMDQLLSIRLFDENATLAEGAAPIAAALPE